MFTKFILVNIQAHKYLEIDLTKGLNVIKGISDIGKSTIIRGIEWLFYNDDSGFSTLRHDPRINGTGTKLLPKEEISSIQGFLDTGEWVIRERNMVQGDRGINQYRTSLHPEPFKALRTGVPEEVKQILKVNQYNLRSQFDTMFLLQDSPPESARMLNEVAGLEIIDTSRKKMESIVSKAKEESESLSKDIETKQKEIEGLSYLDEMRIDIESLEVLENEIKQAEETLERIQYLSRNINELKAKLKELRIWEKLDKELDLILVDVEEVKQKEDLLDRIEKVNENLVKAKKITSQKEKVYGLIKDLNSLSTEIEELGDLEIRKGKINTVLGLLVKAKSRRQVGLQKLASIQQKLQNTMREAGLCPLCGSTVDDEMLERIAG